MHGRPRSEPWYEHAAEEAVAAAFELELKDVYATNVFPFVKLGAMSALISMRDLVRAARAFALAQIEIVEPRLAVCLGNAAFDAVSLAAGRRRTRSLAAAIASPFEVGRTQVWCQAHTGPLGTMARNRTGADQIAKDWARMAAAYDRCVKWVRPGAGISDLAASTAC